MPDPTHPLERMFLLCTGELVADAKVYKFQASHIVGELRLRHDHELDRKVLYLAYFNASLPTTDVPLLRQFAGVYVPYSPRICCTLCERVTHWEINRSAFDALMAHYGVSMLEEG